MMLRPRLPVALSGLLLLVTAVPLIMMELSLRGQILFGVGCVGLGLILNRRKNSPAITYALMALSVLITVRYLTWRATETLPLGSAFDWVDKGLAIGLLLAEFYALVILLFGYFQVLQPRKRKPVRLPKDRGLWPTVDVYIPSYNEPLDVVRPTVLAALKLDWPEDKLRVYVLDDGRREEFGAFCAEVGATHITRDNNRHAKAGNINQAMVKTSGEIIAIFDCDHIPTRSFLQLTVGTMVDDPEVALVQTPHHFFSPDPFERNLGLFRKVPNEGELFYGLLQDGNDYWNATFFCGSCALLRRTALEEVGGIAVETVTEDAHTSLKMHARGWKTAYINIPQAAGLATESLSAHVGQRIRWARGMAQIFRVDNPFFMKGLKWGQRICYANAMLHFFYGIPRIVFLTAPLAYLFFDAKIIAAQGSLIAAYALPHLFLAILTNSRIQGAYRHSFWAEVYETVLAAFIIVPTTLAVVNPKLGKFNVTAKGGIVDRDYFDGEIAKPYIVLFLLNLLGIVVGLFRLNLPEAATETLLLNMAWTTYNLLILGAAIRVAAEAQQRRHFVRVDMQVPMFLRRRAGSADGDDSDYEVAETKDMSYGGIGFVPLGLVPIHPGDTVDIALLPERRLVWLPAVVKRVDDNRASVEFETLSIEQQSYLVYVLYGRADAWLAWRKKETRDRPLRALAHVAAYGAQGARMAFQLLRAPSRKAASHG
ncbi:MAG: UDP-forming cellulose synthase catalytic subunit [Oceanococcaceae bacterium]